VTEHALQTAVHMHGDIHHRVDAERRQVSGRELTGPRIAVGIIGDDGLAARERMKISRVEHGLELSARAVPVGPQLVEIDTADSRAILAVTPKTDALDPKRARGGLGQ
jgi:hypothetical protein